MIQTMPKQNKGQDRDAEKALADQTSDDCACCEGFLIVLSVLVIVLTFPISIWFCIRQVQQYERAVIFRFGKLKTGGAVGPGLFFIIPCIDNMVTIDLRTMTFDVPKQEILTKDSVTVQIDAIVYLNVQNPVEAVCNVANYMQSTRQLALAALRTCLGARSYAEVLSNREALSADIMNHLAGPVKPWGVQVERVEIKDVRLPSDLQRAMAAEAEASREAKAKIIAATGEQNAAVALADAAHVIAKEPGALQLRYLQTLNSIAAEKNSTIVFPLPMDFMSAFMGNKSR